MAKLQEMFKQARRTQNGGGMGFLGKNKAESKPRAAALVVNVSQISAGSAEAALKAGANGIIFDWDGNDTAQFEVLKQEVEAAKAAKESTATGLRITGGFDKLDQERFKQLVELGVQYVILPFNAPARLLSLETKDLEKVVVVPMRTGETYPLYIRSLTALDGISGVVLDFDLSEKLSTLSIEEVLDYRAVREAVRYSAFIHVSSTLSEADAQTLNTLGIQAVVLTAKDTAEGTRAQIKTLSELLEKVYQSDDDKDAPSVLTPGNRR
jgi:hypothetical protein